MSTLTLVPDRAWKCDVCNHVSAWTSDHKWYGSYRDLDGGPKANPIVVTCSDLCRDRAVQLNMVPADAPTLNP